MRSYSVEPLQAGLVQELKHCSPGLGADDKEADEGLREQAQEWSVGGEALGSLWLQL